MCRYNPKIDIVFRKLFGSEESQEILISFVNAILENDVKIEKLEIKNPYNLSNYFSGKVSLLDIKAVDENEIWYDIEMQIGEQGFYGKRALYYWSKVYSDQIEKAENYTDLKKTIGIHLLDFDYFGDEKYFRRIVLKDFETNKIYEDLYFIEMCKFKKEYSELKTVLDRWLTFLNRAYDIEKGNIPKELSEEKKIKEAIEKLEVMYFDKQEREVYESERKHRMDQNEETRTAKEKGREEGLEEGIKEGIEKGRKETARKMLEKAYTIDDVIELTGLSKKEIEELK